MRCRISARRPVDSPIKTTCFALLIAAIFISGASAQAKPRLHGGGGEIRATGTIGGQLQFGVATAVTIQRFGGPADFIGTGTFEVPGRPNFLALAYDCSRTRSALRIDPTAYRPSHTYCRTVYFINTRTRTLAAFWTSSPSFHTAYGTHPGSTQAYASAHEDALSEAGCHLGLERGTPVADLLMENRGGHPREQTRGGVTYTTGLIGGTVQDFELEASTGGVGLLFC